MAINMQLKIFVFFDKLYIFHVLGIVKFGKA